MLFASASNQFPPPLDDETMAQNQGAGAADFNPIACRAGNDRVHRLNCPLVDATALMNRLGFNAHDLCTAVNGARGRRVAELLAPVVMRIELLCKNFEDTEDLHLSIEPSTAAHRLRAIMEEASDNEGDTWRVVL